MEDFDVRSDRLVRALAEALKSKHWRLAAAESCTGGWIAKCCTDMAGSSDWFERGFVTYSNDAKRELLGVDPMVLESEGAVSRAVAEQMAQGAIGRAGVNASLAVTGIAGPDGGSPDKPVGTVWFAWSVAGLHTTSKLCHFEGDRMDVRQQSVLEALEGLLSFLDAA